MAVQDVPRPVCELVRSWSDRGRPAQPGIEWDRKQWIDAFPEHRDLLESLPDALDRLSVATHARDASAGNLEARRAFVVVMTWGFGLVGYGPWRTRRILDGTQDSAARLCATAQALRTSGPLAAYAELAGQSRLAWLGPAFGTKYLYFCSPTNQLPVALILDRLVADWLQTNTGVDLDPVPWSPATYGHYLMLIENWATRLGVPADALECCIFEAQASTRPRSQWARIPR